MQATTAKGTSLDRAAQKAEMMVDSGQEVARTAKEILRLTREANWNAQKAVTNRRRWWNPIELFVRIFSSNHDHA